MDLYALTLHADMRRRQSQCRRSRWKFISVVDVVAARNAFVLSPSTCRFLLSSVNAKSPGQRPKEQSYEVRAGAPCIGIRFSTDGGVADGERTAPGYDCSTRAREYNNCAHVHSTSRVYGSSSDLRS
jgi:hypothetical protein